MSKVNYILREVTDKSQEREFIEFPKRLYKGNRNWVCPLDDDIKSVFDPAKNKYFADGEAIRWVAYNSEGEVVRPPIMHTLGSASRKAKGSSCSMWKVRVPLG